MKNQDIHQGEKVFWTSVITGLGLAIVKGVTGYIANNKALMGDALYTASTAASSLVDRLSNNGTTAKSHTRQNERSGTTNSPAKTGAPFANLMITVLLLLGGLEIGISAVRDLMSLATPDPKPYAIIPVFLSIAINEAVFRYRYRYAKKQKNTRLADDVDNHRYSLYSSILVLAGMLSTIAALELNIDQLYYIEPISAILVAGIVWRQGYRIAKHSIYGSLVQELDQQDAVDFMDTVQRVQGVITVEELKAQEVGDSVKIDLKISVNPQITVREAAEISEYAKNLLLSRFAHVSTVQVQVVPYNGGYPYKSNYELTQSRDTSGNGMLQ